MHFQLIYIDPQTGSLLFQFFLSAFFSVIVFFKQIRLKVFLIFISKKDKTKEESKK